MLRWIVWVALALLAAGPASADWRQARTAHFILSIDDTEANARDFAARLERFDAGLRLLYGLKDDPAQALRPISIYALREAPYFKACGCPGVLGLYTPQASGSFILSLHTPDLDRKAKIGQWSSLVVLLHEYSHHFMFSNFPVAYPMWFSEGFAEFNANTSFEDDGSMIVGYPANYRADGLSSAYRASLKQLLDPEHFGYPDDVSLIYSRGWLLTHMLMLRHDRAGQLNTFLAAMNRGVPSIDAAAQAFGDLKKLDTDLDLYRRGKLAAPLRIPPGPPVAVTVTTMPRGQAALLPLYVQIREVDKSLYLGIAMEAEGIAKRYPDDAVVQSQVAEMEYTAKRLDKADEAADRALALQPDLGPALVVKGRVAVSRASLAKSADSKVWAAARAWYLKANRLDPDAVMPLYMYYTSFVAANEKPTPGAVRALMRSAVLAPESGGIRMAVALQALADGDGATARQALQSIAYSPHATRSKNLPLEALKLIDQEKLAEARTLLLPKDKDRETDGE